MRITALAALMALGFALPAHAQGAFRLSSPDIAEGRMLSEAQVFAGFGCSGGNVAPVLTWSDVPLGTKSFVVTAYDPDAPTGSGWWHWLAYDIPANARGVGPGALPEGTISARNDFGTVGFGGACPPPGAMHRYRFTVTALDVPTLEVPFDASAALIGFMTNAHALGQSTITAVFTR